MVRACQNCDEWNVSNMRLMHSYLHVRALRRTLLDPPLRYASRCGLRALPDRAPRLCSLLDQRTRLSRDRPARTIVFTFLIASHLPSSRLPDWMCENARLKDLVYFKGAFTHKNALKTCQIDGLKSALAFDGLKPTFTYKKPTSHTRNAPVVPGRWMRASKRLSKEGSA